MPLRVRQRGDNELCVESIQCISDELERILHCTNTLCGRSQFQHEDRLLPPVPLRDRVPDNAGVDVVPAGDGGLRERVDG